MASIWSVIEANSTASLSDSQKMPFSETFWRNYKHEGNDTLQQVKGYFTALPVHWTEGENNLVPYNIRLIARNAMPDDGEQQLTDNNGRSRSRENCHEKLTLSVLFGSLVFPYSATAEMWENECIGYYQLQLPSNLEVALYPIEDFVNPRKQPENDGDIKTRIYASPKITFGKKQIFMITILFRHNLLNLIMVNMSWVYHLKVRR